MFFETQHSLTNESNDPPRGELRDSPNVDPLCLCREF